MGRAPVQASRALRFCQGDTAAAVALAVEQRAAAEQRKGRQEAERKLRKQQKRLGRTSGGARVDMHLLERLCTGLGYERALAAEALRQVSLGRHPRSDAWESELHPLTLVKSVCRSLLLSTCAQSQRPDCSLPSHGVPSRTNCLCRGQPTSRPVQAVAAAQFPHGLHASVHTIPLALTHAWCAQADNDANAALDMLSNAITNAALQQHLALQASSQKRHRGSAHDVVSAGYLCLVMGVLLVELMAPLMGKHRPMVFDV